MLHQINAENFKNVYKIIKKAPHSIFAGSVCAGNNPGWVLGDDPVNPTSAFIYTCGLGGTLVGRWDNDDFTKTFIEKLDDEILPKVRDDNQDILEIAGDSHEWDSVIASIPETKRQDTLNIKRFKLERLSKNPATLPQGLEIKKISTEIINNKSIKNIELLINDISDWWSSIDAFISYGFGFTAIQNKTICGWCYSNCILERKAEIYIETVQEFQNKGTGYALARKMVEYCLQNDYSPEWEAFDAKDFSVKIAEKLGYKLDYTYNVYEVMI